MCVRLPNEFILKILFYHFQIGQMSYRNLKIWQKARELTTKIHKMTLGLPPLEQFEEGKQIRRSIKSVRSNIVEGYERRRYKQEFVRFLIFAIASKDETADHLDMLFETNSLMDEGTYNELKLEIEELGRMLHKFLLAIEKKHTKPWSDSFGI